MALSRSVPDTAGASVESVFVLSESAHIESFCVGESRAAYQAGDSFKAQKISPSIRRKAVSRYEKNHAISHHRWRRARVRLRLEQFHCRQDRTPESRLIAPTFKTSNKNQNKISCINLVSKARRF
jgi:hypothetical protein